MSEATVVLRDTIIPKSDQLNYDDVATAAMTVKVTAVKAGSAEQPVIVGLVGKDGKPLRDYKPCKSMRRVLIAVWGDKPADWIGQCMTLVGDPTVKFGGSNVGGIRVSHATGITEPKSIMLTTTRSKRSSYVVEPFAGATPEPAAVEPGPEPEPEPDTTEPTDASELPL